MGIPLSSGTTRDHTHSAQQIDKRLYIVKGKDDKGAKGTGRRICSRTKVAVYTEGNRIAYRHDGSV